MRLEVALRAFGHEVIHVRNTPLRGRPDVEVLDRARAEDRVLVTLDADFGNIVRFPPERFSGIIRLRLRSFRYSSVAGVMERLLSSLGSRSLQGKPIVVTETGFRIR